MADYLPLRPVPGSISYVADFETFFGDLNTDMNAVENLAAANAAYIADISATGFQFNDNINLIFGTDNDTTISHINDNTDINHSGIGSLRLINSSNIFSIRDTSIGIIDDIYLAFGDSEDAYFHYDGGTNIFHLSSANTTFSGNLTVTGTITGDITGNAGSVDGIEGSAIAQLATLASTANGEGASLVGLEDVGNHYDATEVETALEEVGDNIQEVVSNTNVVWGTPAQVGNTLLETLSYCSVTPITPTRIAIVDEVNHLRSLDWNGMDFEFTGTPTTISGNDQPDIATLNSVTRDIVYIDGANGQLRVFRNQQFGSWTAIGNPLTITGFAGRASVAVLTNNLVVVGETSNIEEIRAYSWDGTDFTQVGNGFSVPYPAEGLNMTALNETDIAVIDDGDNSVYTLRWDGSDFSLVGNIYEMGTMIWPSITCLDPTHVVAFNHTSNLLVLLHWDGTDFTEVGSSVEIPYNYMSIAVTSGTDLVMASNTANRILAYRYGFSLGPARHTP